MATQDIAAAVQRLESVFRRRPTAALHDDTLATARWTGGLRVVASHANGTQIVSDMPLEVGGSGDRVSPGWLLRAGLASCTATSIAMAAAAQGIELQSLELEASSRSDARGILGMTDTDGALVSAGPHDVQLTVRIKAAGIPAEGLRKLVEYGGRCSPVLRALEEAIPVDLHIEVETG